MSTVARAAAEYRDAVQAHRETKALLEVMLRNARAKEGRSVAELAVESGFSRQRIYQLLEDKPKEKR